MPLKIYHKDQGFILTGDKTIADEIISRGGIDCTDKPNDYIRRLIHPEFYTEEIKQEEPTLGTVEPTPEPKRRGRPRAN
jgi:hypothetical protein